MNEVKFRLRRADFKVLERIFKAEIENRLPAQFKSKDLPRLEEKGLVVPMSRTFGAGPFALVVRGWALTEYGRMIYCQICAEKSEAANA